MGDFMKLPLIIMALVLSQLAAADSIREERIRQEMLDRVELIMEKSEAAREDLKVKEVVPACEKIKEIFVIYPDHLKAIGSHMDLFRSRTIKAKDEALNHLITLHKQSNICQSGKDSEYVDPKIMSKKLKEIEKDLKRHRRLIKRQDTDHQNQFYYEYQF
jgi:hypothetical protein